jgi:L,D-transpeptidase catalytic domain
VSAARRLGSALGVAVGVAVALTLLARGGPDRAPSRAAPGIDAALARLPTTPAPAFRVGPVRARAAPGTQWAAVARDTPARRSPGGRVVARLAARTPEGTTTIVLPLARRRDARGGLWVRVALPVLPNGTTGWVPRAALGAYGDVRTRLIVSRARRTATLLRAGRPVFHAPVAVGRASAPTPRGRFVVRSLLTRYHSRFYGPVAFGTSARSRLTDWPAGGFIGIHGTDRPDLIPGAVSHGCIRMRNADILRLAKLMPVGTPLTIA